MAFGTWYGYVNYADEWNSLLVAKGAKKEIARWVEGSFWHNYQYGGGLTFLYGNDVIVNLYIEDGKYVAQIRGIIIK